MKTTAKTNRSFSLERWVVKEVERTKGSASASERVNTLLKSALELERTQSLERETQAFFSAIPHEEEESREAFHSASLRSLSRED
jgi:hypothetical protein